MCVHARWRSSTRRDGSERGVLSWHLVVTTREPKSSPMTLDNCWYYGGIYRVATTFALACSKCDVSPARPTKSRPRWMKYLSTETHLRFGVAVQRA